MDPISANAVKPGTEIFVVGIGADVNAAYLTSVASAGQYYSAANYAGLQTILQNLDLCDTQ